jgi:multiple sugar transport system substrate-binding protein
MNTGEMGVRARGVTDGVRATRRAVVWRGGSLALAGGVLGACGQASTGGPGANSGSTGGAAGAQAGGPKRSATYTVRVMVWGDVQDKPVYDNIQADFNPAHTDIKIENDHLAPGGNYYEKFSANLAAGTAPDVAYFQGWMWHEYAAKEALQAVDDLAARDRWTTPWPNDQAYDLQTKFRGKRYMSPSNTGTMIMYYAKEYFDKAGIPYPKEDWTYADFQDLARRLTRQLDGKQVWGYEWNGNYNRMVPWFRMNGGMEWDQIAEPKKANWNTAAIVDALQFQLSDAPYKLGISPQQALLASDANYNRIQFGGVGMKVEGPWFLPQMWGPQARREGGTQFDVQLLPTGRSGKKSHMNLIEGQALLKSSKDKDAAWDVMKWIAGEKGQQRIAEGGRMCNVPQFIRSLWLPMTKQKYNVANADAFLKAVETGTISTVGPITVNVLDRDAGVQAAFNDVRDNKATAAEAMATLQPKIQQLLDQYWATQK